MDPQDIAKLKALVELLKAKPETLNVPDLAFFKSYLESLGARVPKQTSGADAQADTRKPEETKADGPTVEEESEESDVELDEVGVISEDEDLELEMGEAEKEVTEADAEKLSEIRGQASEASNEGNLDEALKLWTEAIKLNPKGSALFAKRAQVLLNMNKPKNAIKDASRAIELNPDQPLAFRVRGRSHGLLGHWEEAASDLNISLKIDYSEEANEWLKEVAGNAKKLRDHKRKIERKRADREVRDRQERVRRAQEERKKTETPSAGTIPGAAAQNLFGMAGNMPRDMEARLAAALQDPEIVSAFQDAEIAAAFEDISANSANLVKYQRNPKVMAVLAMVVSKMGITM
ncbi:heat shock 70kD protein binding protein-like [Tropilaelaps mercedesae]|uniref:Heat shock 70kD protein binding protein-like n=1 Tax=Tropilaelaps mercedesae TaxID=418985 RepID=A0A1V9Y262_9ACAR|nr:heat shock 70kD protein binding protein-like [Tropilaelaps mercedesae]